MQVGDLIQMKDEGTLWLALDIIYEAVLVVNPKTSCKMWAVTEEFEVINASR